MNTKKTHDTVSAAYTSALERSKADTKPLTILPQTSGCCCGPSCCPPEEEGAGLEPGRPDLANMAGYGEEVAEYADVAATSFGCGNPLALAGVQPGQTVLDLGSGAGLDLLIAADKVGPEGEVIGVDMTDAMIASARETISRSGHHNIEVRKGIIEELPVETDSVDWVISNCVINLSPEKDRVFAEIHRVLKPGGHFSISDIVAHDLPEWIRSSDSAYSACVAGAIPEEDYLAGLREAGMVDVEVTERLVYDPAQLVGIVDCCGGAPDIEPKLLERGATEVAGKVWSAKVVGRKPQSALR